jgi:hypothetical protein
MGSDGCYDWVAGTDCSDSDQVCDDSADPAACVDACMDECLPDGATQCSGTVIETCTMGSAGCYEWVAGTDCSSTSEECDDSTGTAACFTPCTDECTTVGDTQCDVDMVQHCIMESDGCNYWLDVVDCSIPGYYCDDTSGDAYCIRPCEDECTTGDTRCSPSGDAIQGCTVDPWDGCYYFTDSTDCTLTSEVCDDRTGTPVCAPPRIMLLGDDALTGDWDQWRAALTSAGVTWDEVNYDSAAWPTLTELSAYHILIWFTQAYPDSNDAECQVVVDWLGLGGRNLFVSGYDFLYDLNYATTGGGEDLLYGLIGADYQGDYAGTGISTIDGVTSDPITDDFSTTPLTLAGSSDSNGDYVDATTSTATSAGVYGTGGSGSTYTAITHYDATSYKAVWLGINLPDGLTDATQQATLVDNVLAFFGI